jgi:hypothetical protein
MEERRLVRGIGLWGATSANMLGTIGVRPFITIPILLAKTDGLQASSLGMAAYLWRARRHAEWAFA